MYLFTDNFIFRYLEFSPLPVCFGTLMFRRRMLEDIEGFRTDLSPGEDTEFIFRTIQKHKIGYLNRPTFHYRHHFSTLTRPSPGYHINHIKLYFFLFALNRDQRIHRLLQRRLAAAYYDLGYEYRKNTWGKGFPFFLKSMWHYPWSLKTYKQTLLSLTPLRPRLSKGK